MRETAKIRPPAAALRALLAVVLAVGLAPALPWQPREAWAAA